MPETTETKISIYILIYLYLYTCITSLDKLPKYDGNFSPRNFHKNIEQRSILEIWTDEAMMIGCLCTDIVEKILTFGFELKMLGMFCLKYIPECFVFAKQSSLNCISIHKF